MLESRRRRESSLLILPVLIICSIILCMALSIVSLNCNGIRDPSKRSSLLQWLRSLPARPNVICLHEAHCTSVQEFSSWFVSSGSSVVCSPGSVHSSGCVVLFRPFLSFSSSWCDTMGHYLQCEFSFLNQSFYVCCLYAPNHNPARDQFLDDLHLKVNPSVPNLLCGDFNMVFDGALDRRGSDPPDSSCESTSSPSCPF